MTKKTEGLKSGRGIQVINPGPDHTFVLDEEALSSLLLREDIRDRAVVVISVAGAFRKGKSFLLDFFLRYMHHTYNLGDSGGWLGEEDEPLDGFSWCGGPERNTTGLLLWSQPFKATLANGDKVVIFLMDTQGTFDSESTVKDNAIVFALSTLISSVQIYNLSQNIEEDDLQHLQLFTDYGRLVQNSGTGKPFQTLQFLVRDWSYPYEYPYGAEGGEKLLEKRLQVREGQHKELQTLRQYIKSCFEELVCYLLPHPGLNVATNPEFDGKLADISEEFKESLSSLVPSLLAPERLVPKLLEGHRVRAQDLLHYFKGYMKIFNGTELPEPKSIMEATAEANNLSAMAEAHDEYDKLMEEVCGGTRPYLQPRVLEMEHQRIKNKALHAFQSKKKMGGQELAERYQAQLEQEMDEKFEQLRTFNDSKNLFNMLATPAVLLVLMAVGFLLTMMGVQTVVAIGQTVAYGAAMLLAVWVYTRMTGNMHEFGARLDKYASVIKGYILQQAGGYHTETATKNS